MIPSSIHSHLSAPTKNAKARCCAGHSGAMRRSSLQRSMAVMAAAIARSAMVKGTPDSVKCGNASATMCAAACSASVGAKALAFAGAEALAFACTHWGGCVCHELCDYRVALLYRPTTIPHIDCEASARYGSAPGQFCAVEHAPC